jgi:hypothetical protein
MASHTIAPVVAKESETRDFRLSLATQKTSNAGLTQLAHVPAEKGTGSGLRNRYRI